MSELVLERFRPQVAAWFSDVYAVPTAAQAQAWESISDGHNALVVAPTGSGKTLAAFLWALNSLVAPPAQTALFDAPLPAQRRRVKVLYISPLKALGVDVEHNLRAPLRGIAMTARRLGLPVPDIKVGVRSGDTTAAERAKLQRTPPDILITTPESLYLMLSSKAAATLSEVETVIVDEIHALAGTKRGSHLALSLERLAMMTSFQRIGLSATVRPLDRVAGFLGPDTVIVAPPAEKSWDLQVYVGEQDMSDLSGQKQGSTIGDAVMDSDLPEFASESALPVAGSMWPSIERDVYAQVMAARSTLVFVNSRRSAERLTSRLNELWALEHDPESLSLERRRDPAQIMSSSDIAGRAPQVIARAHHGSVSKDERALTEQLLKSGELRCVVATSSLELGIDMGAVELVIQVESPPSVAAGLQRVGRAGHAVGETSRGRLYPLHRADLVQTAVIVQRMRARLIEELKVPKNPLDVLAQQTVAAVAMTPLHVDDWFDVVRRAYPYRELPRAAFDAVIDLVSGSYPSTEFSDLRPRVDFDRVSGLLTPRPGAQRVAVTSGGTIPDRGMFGVYLVGGQSGARRVGELDEEMVHETRIGDVFTLGASSWRVEEIGRDQVLVTPAPGHTGRLPFWKGDQAGRPAELGKAVGAFRRNPSYSDDLDENSAHNIQKFLSDQQQATGIIPDEQTLVVERFRDELGDWRVLLHSPYGRGVNAAWALAVGTQFDFDTQVVAGDDGMILRIPDCDVEPGASLFHIDPAEAEDIVAREVGGSALFASRFRECAARALLMPRKHPGQRTPLWQQRQRAAQLLEVARKYPTFPVILETVRECLQDVYDLPALVGLLRDIAARRVRIVEVTVDQPSPFAAALMFHYAGAFMYEGDTPLAEKRAAALALDPALMAQLLGKVELRELLDADVLAAVHLEIRRYQRARTPTELEDTLRMLGPIPSADVEWYCNYPNPHLALTPRMMRARIAGVEHLALTQDAPLLRDGLGVPVPAGVAAPADPITDALEQLLGRWARTHGPFTLAEIADAFGLPIASAHSVVRNLDVLPGHYTSSDEQFCDSRVLRMLRTRSLAAARAAVSPVPQDAFARFLLDWQRVAPLGGTPELSGIDGVYSVIEQLAGVRLPASAWESIVLPSRVANYNPAWLDELTTHGEVVVRGAGKAGSRDPWIMLFPADDAPLIAETPETPTLGMVDQQVFDFLRHGGAYLFHEIRAAVPATVGELQAAIWNLVEVGLVAPDGFQPVRAHLGSGGRVAHRASRRPSRTRAAIPPDLVGRWSAPQPSQTFVPNATERGKALGDLWMARYGVVTRGSIVSEDVIGGFALAYRVFSGFEERGKAMRGYLIDGLGASQFSTSAVVDRLRTYADRDSKTTSVHVVAAADPANPYGAALPWPVPNLSRAAGARVILVDGGLAGYLTRGGKHLTIVAEDRVAEIAHALSHTGDTVAKINGENALTSPFLPQLRAIGARISPQGVRCAKLG
ncbi:DEAD/DEAH box helicase [Corynebacterium sp.]|uniref:DEAD/DEAH box helicase n=1 Tax=Corynebacterium sp. TaxID=1720 RepID=UPI0026DB9719|nr:DEAD/DEAH box helicase [Corynebacterium sp.]MDO5076298.1 DEAD/DEAH box helicase [Corynebacterium sp.]